MQTIRDKIKEVVNLVRESLDKNIDPYEKQDIIDEIYNLGYQWANAEAHVKVCCICAGMMKHGEDEEYDPTNPEQMKALENEGGIEIIKQVGLPTYSGLVTEYTTQYMGENYGDI